MTEPGCTTDGLIPGHFDSEQILPSQFFEMQHAGVTHTPEAQLRLWMLKYAWRDICRRSGRRDRRSLTCLLGIMAWIEDIDGFAAATAGVPYPVSFRAACEVIPGLNAEAMGSAFRRAYRVLDVERRIRPLTFRLRVA